MSFVFSHLPFDDFSARARREPRIRLLARWQRGADGRLECRWLPSPDRR